MTFELPVKYDQLTSRQRKAVRDQYILQQQGRCMFCNEMLTNSPPTAITQRPIDWGLFPGGRNGFLKYPIHLQHCHTSGWTEGAVHAFCNAYMWVYEQR